ncbi:hypothetical protein [Pseudarthrobacter sp. BIM B-2242]|uniref:hypothetical protein n=1 Tax=Pseudarthrobacter sp. BIM B-2242 TaxID=2772401 RepID=UPI00168C0ED8|nr:hypothetical protein [Pseudarthrobacter sp. BIM B-2242]QOD05705.1 hypothetical protein IDT60_21925 [Pseudarthrobacter sp. BIM B-2242]
MSDKLAIFHGYRLPEGTDLIGLAETLRTVFLPIRDTLEIKDIATQASRILSAADVAGTDRPAAVIFDAVQAHSEHVAQILAGQHDCALPVASAAVSDDPATGRLYLLLHARHAEYSRAMDDHGIAEYFPYWDEDEDLPARPLGISEADWTERRAAWERVLRGAHPAHPSGMFQIAFGSPMPDMDVVTRTEEVLAALPTLDDRVRAAFERLASEQEFESLEEHFAFAASVPDHLDRFRAAMKPIGIEDLAGGAS